MNQLLLLVYFIFGLLAGALIGAAFYFFKSRTLKSLTEVSQEALQRNSEQFLVLAKSRLESERELQFKELENKKSLIDQGLNRLNQDLENISELVFQLEKRREKQYGELSNETSKLMSLTSALHDALTSSKKRGEFGESLIDDILKASGLIEGIHYEKQKTVEGALSGPALRPDFTFNLPKGRKLNIDVKFPFENYVKFLRSESETDKKNYIRNFLYDVKGRIKEIASKEYINPEKDTLDYALMVIPNEQIYAFIYENDSSIFKDAMQKKILICSPIILLGILAIIRESINNFAVEQKSREIFTVLTVFKKEWVSFTKDMANLGGYLGKAKESFDSMVSKRQKKLDNSLEKIDKISEEQELLSGTELLSEENKNNEKEDAHS